MKKLTLILFVALMFSCDFPNQSPESLAKHYIQYAKEGDFINITNNITYYESDNEKNSALEYYEKLSKEKLPNGISKQIPLVNYYKDKYKNSYLKEINDIGYDMVVIKIVSESYSDGGRDLEYTGEKGMFIDYHFAGNFNGGLGVDRWYIIGTNWTLTKNKLNALEKNKSNSIKKYIVENKLRHSIK
tara:strand:- start:518 stop:1078 length:561 start_codon:yes stop_codon:yes gene_type:complete